MLSSHKKHNQVLFIFILYISINICYAQNNTSKFRSSNIELIPSLVVINSTSITNFVCINYDANNSPLEVNISKIISPNEIKISTNILNKTAIDIQLELKNYVGLFHLLCYTNGEQHKGTRADIIVKAAPGVLQLIERCRVYDKQYIKCVIRAPIIARAIQNGYPPRFEFNELSHSSDQPAYIPRFEFLKNESTNEYLTFKWRPMIDGEFPYGVRMHMKAMLPHFDVSQYFFDMTPVFRIKPKFFLQTISSNEIQINITPTYPPAYCEKSILPKLISNINQTWTNIEPKRNSILINNLIPNTIYRICIKCRQEFTDPDGIEECDEIKTLSRFILNSNTKLFIIIITLLIVILFIIFSFGYYFWSKRRRKPYKPVNTSININQHEPSLNPYEPDLYDDFGNISINIDTQIPESILINNTDDDDTSIISHNGEYMHIASLLDVIQICSPPKILFPSGK